MCNGLLDAPLPGKQKMGVKNFFACFTREILPPPSKPWRRPCPSVSKSYPPITIVSIQRCYSGVTVVFGARRQKQ